MSDLDSREADKALISIELEEESANLNKLGQMAQEEQNPVEFDVSQLEPIISPQNIKKGLDLFTKYVKAETQWKRYILQLTRNIVITFKISDTRLIRFLIRFLASLMNNELLYFTNEENGEIVRKSFMLYFKTLTKDRDYYDSAPPSTRNQLVRDIVAFLEYYEEKEWDEIKLDCNGLTWNSWKKKIFGKPEKKRKNVNQCPCNFCVDGVGLCLERIFKRLDGKDDKIEILMDKLDGARSVVGDYDDEEEEEE